LPLGENFVDAVTVVREEWHVAKHMLGEFSHRAWSKSFIIAALLHDVVQVKPVGDLDLEKKDLGKHLQ
jgi:hypothetical protein